MARAALLCPRKVPGQPRSRATVEKILDASAQLLRQLGADRLTTNAVAERAGINVASLYSYFPNKFAILAALWDRMQERQRARLRELDRDGDITRLVDAGIDATFEFVLREPGFVELADAVRRVPELRELSEQAHADATTLLRELLTRRSSALRPTADVDAVAAVLVEATSAILATARRASPQRRKRIVAQLKSMLTAYLSAQAAPSRPSQ